MMGANACQRDALQRRNGGRRWALEGSLSSTSPAHPVGTCAWDTSGVADMPTSADVRTAAAPLGQLGCGLAARDGFHMARGRPCHWPPVENPAQRHQWPPWFYYRYWQNNVLRKGRVTGA